MSDGIEITLAEIYHAQQAGAAQTGAQIAALSAQVGQLTATVNLRLESGQRKMDDLEQRMRGQEQSPKVSPQDFGKLQEQVEQLKAWRWKSTGAILAINAIAAALIEIWLKGGR